MLTARCAGESVLDMGTRVGSLLVVGLAGLAALTGARDGRAGAGLASPDWQTRIELERSLAEIDPSHQPRIDRGALRLGEHARFDGAGLHDAQLTVGLRALGREGSMRDVDEPMAEIAGPEVRITRAPGVVEWWRSLPSGLEQGVTLERRPEGEGSLRLEMTTGDGLRVELASNDEVVLRGADGQAVARYAHLVVVDATSARLPARLAVWGDCIRIEVDDEHARYPLVVDPLLYIVEEARLLASGGTGGDYFGVSVALSSDASRALVGAHLDDTPVGTDVGSARVFLRAGATWVEEATLLAVGGAMSDMFGISVALSSDGSRALVGVSGDDTAGGVDTGSARVFLRTGATWVEEATLLAAGGAFEDRFGCSVALSSDGSRALVGAYGDDTAAGMVAGSARVFLRTGTTWTAEATLLASGGAAFDYFGDSVALNSDASRALVGAPWDDTAGGADTGSARVFLRTGAVWVEEATLVASGGAAGDRFGGSVALSSDGVRALVGANEDDTAGGTNAGSAGVFVRTGAAWSEEATLLASGGALADVFGSSVALSSDGSRAIVGAYWADTGGGANAGSARVFLRAGASWREEATLLAPAGAANAQFGFALALSSDGSRALVGAINEIAGGTNAGSAHVFSIVPGAAQGAPCGADAECLSGFCTDGVCCESACGGAALDCQACRAALTGLPSGTCALLSAAVATTVTCRAASDACDVAEVCDAASRSCPTDALAPATTVCRAPASTCDAAELCTGLDAACAADRPAIPSTLCRAPAGPCDAEERCDGASFVCPGDALVGAGIACGVGMVGTCSGPGLCNGTSASCPTAAVRPAGTVCLPAMGGNPCDVDDVCNGSTDVCPAIYAPPTTLCGSVVSGVCDAVDHCSGTGSCLAEYLSGVECRATSGACDLAEVCAGASTACPPDAVAPAGLSCRASTDTTCDPEEACDGVATACPGDENACAARLDAGAAVDGGAGADAGLGAAAVGCGCRAIRRDAPPGAAITGLVLLAARRRRRPSR